MVTQIVLNPDSAIWVQGDTVEAITQSVRITRNYSLAESLVTATEYSQVRSWGLTNGYTDLSDGVGSGDLPIIFVSWFDAVKFCNAISEKDGLNPCYTVAGSVYRIGELYPDCNWDFNGYRLPTESEWEYACRLKASLVGNYTGVNRCAYAVVPCTDQSCPYCTAPGEDIIEDVHDEHGIVIGQQVVGWRRNQGIEPIKSRSPIGQFYDLIGNVLEWVFDIYSPYDGSAVQDDPVILSGSDPRYRVVRGGDYGYMESNMFPSSRQCCNAKFKMKNLGFRISKTEV